MGAISERGRIGEREPQRMRALASANRVRIRRASLKRRICRGEATVGQALQDRHDDCLRNAMIMEILVAQRRWGRKRALELLRRAGVRESRALGRLTDREVSAITRGTKRFSRYVDK